MVYKTKVSVVLGIRPEIIKMAPVIKELERRKADFCILHTGQHYTGAVQEGILECSRIMLGRENKLRNTFGDGKAGERIVNIIMGSNR